MMSFTRHKQMVFVDFAKVNDEQTGCKIKHQTLSNAGSVYNVRVMLSKKNMQ